MDKTVGVHLSNGERIIPVSADSHIVEPDNCYVDHIESRYRDTAPRYKLEEIQGVPTDVMVIDGMKERFPIRGLSSAGRDTREFFLTGLASETHRGGWEPNSRIEAQDHDGVAAEIIYPSFGMLLCGHPDKDYKHACLWAYNRWLQEFVGQHPNRLFGLGQTAVRSVKEAVEDVRRIKDMGFKGVMLPGFPETEEDYSDPVFDPLWEASIALEMPVSFHIIATSSTKTPQGTPINAFNRGKSRLTAFQMTMRTVQDVLSMFVFDGVFDRHPKLKVVCSEADAGWVPHFSYRMDHNFKRFWGTTKGAKLSKLPSTYFNENIYVTFQDDWVAFRVTDMMNPRRMLWANDFPHGDSTWPNSQALLQEHASHLSDNEKRWILRDNVIDLYKLQVPA